MKLRNTLASLLLLAAPLCASGAHWPDIVAPCNGTLQACIDGTAAGGTVLVHSNAVIDESLTIDKPFTLAAAPGYRPVLAAERRISGTVGAAGLWTWRVEGFTLRQGFVQLVVAGGTLGRAVLRDLRIEAHMSGAPLIGLRRPYGTSTRLDYEISGNLLDYDWSLSDGVVRAALQVLDYGSSQSGGRIWDNVVTSRGSRSHGIAVYSQNHPHRVALHANQIHGAPMSAIYLQVGSLSGGFPSDMSTLVSSNMMRGLVPGEYGSGGIMIDALAGSLELEAMHNTVVDAFRGLGVFSYADVSVSGAVSGNVFANTSASALMRPAGVSDSHNLFFATPEGPGTPGLSATSIFADPRFVAPGNPRLAAGSPAIDVRPAASLQAELQDWSLPGIDADGLRRVKQANGASGANALDLGALEAGDTTLVHRVGATPGNLSPVSHPALDGFADAAPLATSNWNPDADHSGVYSNHAASMYFVSPTWRVRNESRSSFAADAAYNVFVPGRGDGRFIHVTDASNTAGSHTVLDDPFINNRENMLVMATRSHGPGTVADLTVPVFVNYFSGAWSVTRASGTLTSIGRFNIYAQPRSRNAFVHTATVANTFGNSTELDHPLLNDRRCAGFHVTQVTDFGITNNHHIGVWWDEFARRWAIYNQDLVPIPAGARFHVLVDPAAVDCPPALFRDGFEDG